MAKNKDNDENKSSETAKTPETPVLKGIVDQNISAEMKSCYLDYAMSVITARALPDARDGLKPVHRRILHAMNELHLTASAKTRKSAAVVGEVLGNYHPHGDSSVYEAMVKMAQDFSMRYPLIVGQGNFGNIDGDGAAAMRYTEAKMAKLAGDMLADIEKETVDFTPNYDATRKEPVVLPTRVPNLLLNGTLGIAVGMATNIPPHNLSEIIDATAHLIDNEKATNDDVAKFVKGPDFPTGGIAFSEVDIHHAFATGRGGVVCRGEAEIVESKSGQFQILITSIPFRVVKASLIEQIADLVREKKVEGVKGLRDESAKDIRIVIDVKTGASPQVLLNYLYKHTQLEDTFHYNMVALVDGVPQTLSLKSLLTEFIAHRQVVVRRRTEFDLRKAKEREHILLGLKKALDHIDEIIQLIKKSKTVDEARQNLMTKFKFSILQANAILEMKLQKLAGLERKKIEDELNAVQALIKELEELLASPKKISKLIKTELLEIKEKYGDDRKTRIVKHGAKNFSIEDLVPDDDSVLVLTAGGYVKRTAPEEYKKQKRGGVGVVDLDTKEEDFVTHLVSATAHNDILFFTDKGKVYRTKMYDLPESKRATRGKAIVNFLQIEVDEKITSILPMPKDVKGKDMAVMMITEKGIGKQVALSEFEDVRRNGIIAMKFKEAGDRLVSASFVNKGDSVVIVTEEGQSIHFLEEDVSQLGRSAMGVIVMRLDKSDKIISADIVHKEWDSADLLVMSENGYGKKTDIDEFKIQGRGGSGIKAAEVTTKIGKIVAAKIITEEIEEAVAMSKNSQVIRLSLNEVPSLGRATQGVRIMKLREGDKIATFVCL